MVCMSCAPNCERVKLTFEIGMAIDLAFADFQGLANLIKEAQADLEWRRELLRLNANSITNSDLDQDPDQDQEDGPGGGFAAGAQD